MSTATYYIGDTFDVVRTLPEASVDLVLTSPPFLALRSYLPADHPDKHKEIGSEPAPAEFLDTLLALTAEWGRVLAPHGSICVELGDTYSGSSQGGGDFIDGSGDRTYVRGAAPDLTVKRRGDAWPLDKSLCGIPHLYHLSLAYGRNLLTGEPSPAGQWRVRNVVAWCRPNPPVGALGDKFRPATSYMTIATRARDRWFDLDAVRTEYKPQSGAATQVASKMRTDPDYDGRSSGTNGKSYMDGAGAPPLDWWNVSTEPYSGSHYACVDADTEALTRQGWKRHDQLVDGDEIAAYDATRGALEWQPATFHRYPFSGELVAIDQRETVQRLTPNHRVIHKTGRGNVATRRADEAVPSWRVPVAAPFTVHDPNGPGVEMAALLGWYITEGSVTSRNVVRIYQSETANPKHCARIRDLLDAVGADYSERRRVRPVGASLSPRESVEVTWVVRGDIARWLMVAAPDKQLTTVPLGWSADECDALLDALIAGDGHERPSGRRAFVQKDRQTIDAVQALCCRLGLRSTISQRLDGGYSLTIGERSWVSLRGTDGASKPVGREHYEGVVWCPAVPATYWLARRSGRPFITGNTWPRKLLDRPIKAMCPMQVCTVCGEPRRRIVEPTAEYASRPNAGRDFLGADHDRGQGLSAPAPHRPGNDPSRKGARYDTVGWTDCGHDSWRNGIVLDPFAGSGTTLAVATGHGRDAIGIDLDERNADLASERIGMFLTVTDTREVAS